MSKADGSIVIELKFDKSAYDKGFEEAEKEAKDFADKLKDKFSQGNSFLDKLGNGLTNFGEKLKSVGQGVTNFGKALAPLSASAAGLLTASVKGASDFTNGMAKMSTLFDTTKYSVNDLSKQFLELSNNTGISATELAEAGYQALSAGQSVEQVGQFVETAGKLAKAGFTSTTTAVDVLTTAMNAYGESAGTAEEIANKLVRTQNLGKTTVDELASSMGKIIPTASSMNVNIDNLTAGYVALTKQGIATAEATTYMNSMLNELGDSGTKIGKILKEKTGKSFQDLMAEGYSLADVLNITKQYAKENGKAYNELWGSAEAGKAALALLNGGVDEFNNTVDTMASKTDDVGEALEKLETPSVKVQKAFNRVKNSGIELGTTILAALAPTINKLVDGVEKVTTWFNSLGEGTKTTIATVLAFVAAAAPVIMIIGKVISVVGTVITFVGKAVGVIKNLWAVFAAATGPVGIAIAIITAVVAAFVLLWNNSEAFREFWINLWEQVKSACSTAAEWIMGALDSLGTFFTTTVPATLSSLISQIVGFFAQIISDTASWCANIISQGAQAGSQFVTSVVTWIQELPGRIWSFLTQTVNSAAQFVSNFANKAREAGNRFKNDLVNAIQELPGRMISIGSNIVSGIWNGISGAWGALVSNVKGLCSNLVSGFTSALGINSPSKVFRKWSYWIPSGIGKGIKDGASVALNAVKSLANDMVGVVTTDDLATRFALESGAYGYAGNYIGGNTYTVNQTINSAKELTPSEIAEDTKNAIRRLAWQ